MRKMAAANINTKIVFLFMIAYKSVHVMIFNLSTTLKAGLYEMK